MRPLNPDVFDPEGHIEDESLRLPTFFAHGLRACLKMRFALTILRIALVYILYHYKIESNAKTTTHKISLNEILWVLEFFKMLSFYQTTRRIIEDFFGQFQTACLSVFYVFWLGLSLPFAMQDQRIAMAFVVKNFSCWGIK